MAELATLARPYAEALFQVALKGHMKQIREQLDAMAAVAADSQLRSFADAPKAGAKQVFDLITSVVGMPLSDAAKNLLRTVIDNGRLSALPEIATQFTLLVNRQSGLSDATVYSAFEMSAEQVNALAATLEKKFGRKLNPTVEVDPSLIGGVRVVVGDEVLDTSVRAKLQQMHNALVA